MNHCFQSLTGSFFFFPSPFSFPVCCFFLSSDPSLPSLSFFFSFFFFSHLSFVLSLSGSLSHLQGQNVFMMFCFFNVSSSVQFCSPSCPPGEQGLGIFLFFFLQIQIRRFLFYFFLRWRWVKCYSKFGVCMHERWYKSVACTCMSDRHGSWRPALCLFVINTNSRGTHYTSFPVSNRFSPFVM